MGFFRFRRSFKIAPGVRINLSKGGTSTSIGPRGATVNLRGGKVRATVGVPGSGISYSEQTRSGNGIAAAVLLIALIVLFFWFAL